MSDNETFNPVTDGLPDVTSILNDVRLSNRQRLILQLELNIEYCQEFAAADLDPITRAEDLQLENLFRLIRHGLKNRCLTTLKFEFAGEVK